MKMLKVLKRAIFMDKKTRLILITELMQIILTKRRQLQSQASEPGLSAPPSLILILTID